MTVQQSARNLMELVQNTAVEWKILDEIGFIYGGLIGKNKHDFINGNSLYVPYKNIFDNIELDVSNLGMVRISLNEKQHEVGHGDILFTSSSEIADEVGMSSAVISFPDRKLYLNSFSFGLRFNKCINIMPEFAKYLFRSQFIRKEIIKTASGVTRFNISKERFKKLQIPIPPLEIQEKIVKVLDKFTELEATLEADLQLRRQQYNYYRDFLLNFDDREDVEWKRLGEVALDFGRGKSKHRPRNDVRLYGGDIPFIQTGDIKDAGHIIDSYSQTYNELGLSQSKLWKKGTLCITIAANIAETAILGFDACFPDSVIGFVANPNKTTTYYVEYLLSNLKTKLQKKSMGSAQENINLTTFNDFLFPFPPLSEQARIVAILDKFDTLTTSLTEGLPREIALRRQQYEYYREQLLNFPRPTVKNAH